MESECEEVSTTISNSVDNSIHTIEIVDDDCTLPNSCLVSKEPQVVNVRNGNELPLETMENEDKPSPSISQATSKGPLEGWTKEEKYQLYLGIKYKSSKKVVQIQETIPNKTVEEIKAAIAHYKARANQNPECTSRKLKVRRCRTKPLIPLASWAKLLTDNLNYNELQTELVSAIRLIADLEDIPPPIYTEQIDFRKVYHQIADAMEGKSLSDSRLISEVLNSCVLDTVLVSKQFIRVGTFKHIVNTVSFKERTLPFFPRPTPDNELAIIRHLGSQRNYNPLCITEEHLMAASNIPIINLCKQ